MIPLREPPQGRAATLSNIYDGALQQVYDIIEDICTESENDLIGEPPWSTEVVAKQAVAYAQRALFLKLDETIRYHVTEFKQQEPADSAKKRGFKK
jgi:hypothetical protein